MSCGIAYSARWRRLSSAHADGEPRRRGPVRPRPPVVERLARFGVVRLGLIAAVATGLCAGGSAVRSTLEDQDAPIVLAVLAGAIVGSVVVGLAMSAFRRCLAAAARIAGWSRAHPALLPALRLPALVAGGGAAAPAAVLLPRSTGRRLDPAAPRRARDPPLPL